MSERNHPHPVYELSLSARCLFLSVAAATAVHDITEIFMTAASKSRQTDDKHVCGWFHFSDLKFITRRTHTPLSAFVLLFMTQVSWRHRLFLTGWLSCRLFFVVLFDSATATCQWSTALIRKKKPTSSKMLRRTYLCVFATEILQIELNFTVYYFYIVLLEHRVLMQAELPKDGSAITQPFASGISNFHFLFVLVSAELSI